MNLAIFSILLLTSSYASVCDATYSINSAILYTGHGDNLTNLQFTQSVVEGDLSIPAYHGSPVHYRFPVELTSQCAVFGMFPTAPSNANFATRDSGAANFVINKEESWNRFMNIQSFSGGPIVGNVIMMYADTLQNARDFIMEDSTDGIYKATYGTAVYYDTLYLNGEPVEFHMGSFQWRVSFDTSYFMGALRESALNTTCEDLIEWPINPDLSCTRDLNVQMLVVQYDTTVHGDPWENNSLNLTSLDGGEVLDVGSTQNITWSSIGFIPDVKIEYTTDGIIWKEIAASTENDGSFDWVVPNVISKTVRVRISDVDNTFITDESEAVFEVIQVVGVNNGKRDGFTFYLADKVIYLADRIDFRQIRIFNTFGKLVNTIEVKSPDSERDGLNLKNGVYLIELLHSQGKEYHKIVAW